MKKLAISQSVIIFLLIIFVIFLIKSDWPLSTDKMVWYDSTGYEHEFHREKVSMEFQIIDKTVCSKVSDTTINKSGVVNLIPTFISLGYKIITEEIKKQLKKYTAEYTIVNSFLEADLNNCIPALTIKREFDDQLSLSIKLEPVELNDHLGFTFYLSEFELSSSKAKTTSDNNMLDYVIVPTLFYIENGQKKTQVISPIVLKYVKFGDMVIINKEFRTEIIPFIPSASFTGASIKITESNPAKVRVENILAKMESYEDEVKGILDYILKKILEDKNE